MDGLAVRAGARLRSVEEGDVDATVRLCRPGKSALQRVARPGRFLVAEAPDGEPVGEGEGFQPGSAEEVDVLGPAGAQVDAAGHQGVVVPRSQKNLHRSEEHTSELQS